MPTEQHDFIVHNVPKDWFITWNMFTQAGYKVHTLMTDESGTKYVNNSTQDLPRKQLASGYSQIHGDNLKLQVTVEGASRLRSREICQKITNDRGVHVGTLYSLWVEDADDRDFNDLVVTIVASRGEK